MRQRKVTNSSHNGNLSNEKDVLVETRKNSRELPWWILLHVACVFAMVWGYVMNTQSLCTGIECEMTYSRYQFLPIPINTVYNYGLYKFLDGRDPRQQKLRQDFHQFGIVENKWCLDTYSTNNNTIPVVLYIPGHWGSHLQARSLGAHGLQLTRRQHSVSYTHQVVQKLLQNDLEFYSVYAVDFGQQGTGLHGSFVRAQSEFVSQAVMALVNNCGASSVTLVAHSVGGLVARSVGLWHSETSSIVKNIITLATPHSVLPYAVEESIHDVYQEIRQKEQELRDDLPLTISLAGGIRDEQIPPITCLVNSGVSVLVTNIMTPSKDQPHGQPMLGMDHRAIVWCHSVLEVVRRLIFALTINNDDASDRIHLVRKTLGMARGNGEARKLQDANNEYLSSVRDLQRTFRESHGVWASLAMEAAMLYHLELLLGLYVMVCVLSSTEIAPFIGSTTTTTPLVASCLAFWWSDAKLRFPSVVILAFVAHSIFCLVQYGVFLCAWICSKFLKHQGRRVLDGRMQSSAARFLREFLGVVISVCGLLFGYSSYYEQERSIQPCTVLFLSSVLFLLGSALSAVVRTSTNGNDVTSFVAMLLPILPILVAGKLIVIGWYLTNDKMTPDPQAMKGVFQFTWKIVIPLLLWLFVSSNVSGRRTARWPFAASRCVVILWLGPIMMKMGGAYVVGYFVAAIAFLDSLTIVLGIVQKFKAKA